MKKEPINKDAFGYVRLHVYVPVSKDEFITVEKYVAEMHNSFYCNETYGDADLRRFVYQKLTEKIYPLNDPKSMLLSMLYMIICLRRATSYLLIGLANLINGVTILSA